MPTGADSDPKQLLTYSPNFSFRKFSATGETNRIRNRTLPCITNSAQFSTTLDYTRITLLMWFPQYRAKPSTNMQPYKAQSARLCVRCALIIRIAVG
jgi:hypothetical protein